jgi:hypothetical protein
MPGPNVVSTSAIAIHNNKPNQTVFFNTTLTIWNLDHQCFFPLAVMLLLLLLLLPHRKCIYLLQWCFYLQYLV